MAQMTITAGAIDISGTAAKNLYDNRIDDMKIVLSIWSPPHWMKIGAEHCYHPACPVPVGIIKAIEIEAGLALPADASIKLSKTGG